MNRVQHIKKLKTEAKFYKNSFNLHAPYIVLCDPNFVHAALMSKINIEDRLKEIFKGQIYLKVTQCGMSEIKGFKKKEFDNTIKFANKHCQLFRCNSHKPTTPHDCILDNLKHGFTGIVGTQDSLLRRKIAKDYPQIPIFFINEGLQITKPTKNLRNKIRSEIEAKYSTKPKEDVDKPSVKEPFEEEVAPDETTNEENKCETVIEETVIENK